MKKKVLSTIAVLLSFIVMAQSALAVNFSDLTKEWDWASDYIYEMADMGIITGYPDGTFMPQKSVTNQEAIALFARVMGSSDETNSEIVDLAYEMYADDLEKYDTYAEKEVAFLLYRGVLKISELEKYIGKSTKNEPLKRYEAAVLITKIFGAEDEVKSSIMIDLNFADTSDIPIDYRGYVHFANEKGIMQGMGDNIFSPLTDVRRSEIAVMLYKVMKQLDYTYITSVLTSFDAVARNITIKDEDSQATLIGVSRDVIYRVEGSLTQLKDLPTGVEALITFSGDSVAFVDITVATPDETITGLFSGYSNKNGVISIDVYPMGGSAKDSVTYKLADNVSFRYDNSPATIRSFSSGDVVSVETKKGLVTLLEGKAKTTKITDATIEEIVIDKVSTIKISHPLKEYDGMVITLGDTVSVIRNDDKATLANIVVGDKGTLTLEYDAVTAINVKSVKTTVNGSIEAINISKSPSVTINVDGKEYEYSFSRDTVITLDSKESDIYDLRLGYNVKVNLDGQTVTKIESQTVVSSLQKMGVVEATNTSLNTLIMNVADSYGGYTQETVYVKNTVTVVNGSTGASMKFSDVKEGQTIMVTGVMNGVFFQANTIIIMPSID